MTNQKAGFGWYIVLVIIGLALFAAFVNKINDGNSKHDCEARGGTYVTNEGKAHYCREK